MNIFYTNHDPLYCAQDHCTIHTIKMIVEYAQILSTAHNIIDGDKRWTLKTTHKNHPSSVWARESIEHYKWLWEVLFNLVCIYNRSGHRDHKFTDLTLKLKKHPAMMKDRGFKNPPMCMPDEFKSESIIESYRNYVLSKYKEWSARDRTLIIKWYFDAKPCWVI